MKLRNKKTGEIRNAVDIDMYTDLVYLKVSDGEFDNETIEYHSLAELNAEWEDYEEPKEYWHIFGTNITKTQEGFDEIFDKRNKEIGNYFKTKEEAEKAVEKLKAWKRLKDKGLEVTEWSHGLYLDKTIVGRFRYEFPIDNKEDIEKDLDLLFGGEK